MRTGNLSILICVSLLGVGGCTHAPTKKSAATPPITPKAPRLVLISVDGMRPAFYQTKEYRQAAPTLARLADEGIASKRGIIPVFPSITYPDHTSMVTGVYPDKHGIVNNKIVSQTRGLTEDWYWYADEIQVPTLWQKAEQAGLKVALIRWPASTGANVHWSLPEIFNNSGKHDSDQDWELLQRDSTPGFLERALSLGEMRKATSVFDYDQLDTQAVAFILGNLDADLILLHLVNLDHVQHGVGIHSPAVDDAAGGIDGHLKQIVSMLDPTKTTLIVTGDHGFANYSKVLHMDALTRLAGLDDQVFVQADGGQAVVYPQPGSKIVGNVPCEKLVSASRKFGPDLITLISRAKLTELHAYPRGLCGLEAKMGVALSEKEPPAGKDAKAENPVLENLDKVKGHHGYLPSRPEMRAGFLMWGKGVTKRHDFPRELHMPDIAPTAAGILGISPPAGALTRGRKISF